jgi:predicted MFS family arabinose efflux permease
LASIRLWRGGADGGDWGHGGGIRDQRRPSAQRRRGGSGSSSPDPLGVIRNLPACLAGAAFDPVVIALQSITVGAVVFGSYFFLSLYMQEVKQYSPLHTGSAFLPIGLMTFAGALIASRLVRRLGVRRQLIVAPLVTALAMLWLSQLTAYSSYFSSLFAPMLLAGLSIGVTFVPMTMAGTMGVPRAQAGLPNH